MDTPVPISNTEVKHRSGEDILRDKIASRRAFLFYVDFYNIDLIYFYARLNEYFKEIFL